MNKKCYLCGASKTSVEHVPAKCFFPNDEMYRKNLITVPSCKEHNENTSNDDEYVRNIICMSIGNNNVAYQQFIKKVLTSLKRNQKLKSTTFNASKKVSVAESGDKIRQTIAIQIERARFDKVMRKIGYALYYYEYQKIWERNLIVATPCLVDSNMQQDEYGELINSCKQSLQTPIFDGNNPKVFQYKFLETKTEDVLLWIKFYEGFEVFLIPKTETFTSCI